MHYLFSCLSLCNSEVLSELIRLIITEPPPASPPSSSAESSPKKEAEKDGVNEESKVRKV